MTTNRTKNPKRLLGVVALVVLSACEVTTGQDATETDAFVQNALDTYGVIDVVPSAPLPAATRAAPIDTASDTAPGQPTLTFDQVCAGRSGIHESQLSEA